MKFAYIALIAAVSAAEEEAAAATTPPLIAIGGACKSTGVDMGCVEESRCATFTATADATTTAAAEDTCDDACIKKATDEA